MALLSLGAHLSECLAAAEELEAEGIGATVADARFAKPLDTALIDQLVRHHHGVVVTVEQGAQGGFGAMVLHYLANSGQLDGSVALRTMTLPDRFIDHASPEAMYREAGLTRADILRVVRDAVARRAGRVVRLVPRGPDPGEPWLLFLPALAEMRFAFALPWRRLDGAFAAPGGVCIATHSGLAVAGQGAAARWTKSGRGCDLPDRCGRHSAGAKRGLSDCRQMQRAAPKDGPAAPGSGDQLVASPSAGAASPAAARSGSPGRPRRWPHRPLSSP